MKKINLVIVFLYIIFCLLMYGCNKNEETFLLNEKYYESSEFNELSAESLNNLINDKESFAIFIYQPLCSSSNELNKVLIEFTTKYQISFYKLSFTNMKETQLKNYIKYYPSVVIFKEGKIVDYLDADSDEDIEYYKNIEGFEKWFSSYVSLKKEKNNSIIEEKKDNSIKIDVKLENVKYDENKVNIYFFWGDGCPHCEKEFSFLENIKEEYGNYFTLNTFEVWHNKDNEKILKQFASAMGDEVLGVPYTIIGNKTFKGFKKEYEEHFLQAIKNQHQNSFDIYFKNTK